jgi:hypothetical protein
LVFGLVALSSVVLFAGFGWLVVRLTRPRSTGVALGFAIAVAAVASACSALFTAPLLIERARAEVAEGHGRVHPVSDDDPDRRWLEETKRPGTDAHAEGEYLKQFLPPEQQGLDHEGWETDLRRLKRNASEVNRLRSGYRALAEDLSYGTVGTILWAMFSTWAVVYLDRKYGRRWSNVVRYLELSFPSVMALGMIITAVVVSAPGEDRWVLAALAGYFGVMAVVAWVGIARRWRWWVRWGLYVLAIAGLSVATVVVLVVFPRLG